MNYLGVGAGVETAGKIFLRSRESVQADQQIHVAVVRQVGHRELDSRGIVGRGVGIDQVGGIPRRRGVRERYGVGQRDYVHAAVGHYGGNDDVIFRVRPCEIISGEVPGGGSIRLRNIGRRRLQGHRERIGCNGDELVVAAGVVAHVIIKEGPRNRQALMGIQIDLPIGGIENLKRNQDGIRWNGEGVIFRPVGAAAVGANHVGETKGVGQWYDLVGRNVEIHLDRKVCIRRAVVQHTQEITLAGNQRRRQAECGKDVCADGRNIRGQSEITGQSPGRKRDLIEEQLQRTARIRRQYISGKSDIGRHIDRKISDGVGGKIGDVQGNVVAQHVQGGISRGRCHLQSPTEQGAVGRQRRVLARVPNIERPAPQRILPDERRQRFFRQVIIVIVRCGHLNELNVIQQHAHGIAREFNRDLVVAGVEGVGDQLPAPREVGQDDGVGGDTVDGQIEVGQQRICIEFHTLFHR